jgi:lipopolysaccharide export system permease protein
MEVRATPAHEVAFTIGSLRLFFAEMKTLHLYLLRQVLGTLVMTVMVFTFVLLLGNILKEVLPLLINRQASLGGLFEAVGLLIPWVLVFALPMGMMTAALLVFGRFSADQELTAARASGISLLALVTPVLILSLLLCGVSAWINLDVAPQCRMAFKNLLNDMRGKISTAALPEGRMVRQNNYMFYIGRNDGQNLHDILIYRSDTNQEIDLMIKAPWALLETMDGKMSVVLIDAQGLAFEMGKWDLLQGTKSFPLTPDNSETTTPLSDMSYRQLQGQLRDLEQTFSAGDTHKLSADDLRKQKMALETMKRDLTMPVRFQMHLKVATSFACFGFTLVGIPLGIRAHRRETNFGIAMALVLVFIYYAFVIVGQSLQARPEFAPQLIVWVPNFIFQSVGAVLLWRANKGT